VLLSLPRHSSSAVAVRLRRTFNTVTLSRCCSVSVHSAEADLIRVGPSSAAASGGEGRRQRSRSSRRVGQEPGRSSDTGVTASSDTDGRRRGDSRRESGDDRRGRDGGGGGSGSGTDGAGRGRGGGGGGGDGGGGGSGGRGGASRSSGLYWRPPLGSASKPRQRDSGNGDAFSNTDGGSVVDLSTGATPDVRGVDQQLHFRSSRRDADDDDDASHSGASDKDMVGSSRRGRLVMKMAETHGRLQHVAAELDHKHKLLEDAATEVCAVTCVVCIVQPHDRGSVVVRVCVFICLPVTVAVTAAGGHPQRQGGSGAQAGPAFKAARRRRGPQHAVRHDAARGGASRRRCHSPPECISTPLPSHVCLSPSMLQRAAAAAMEEVALAEEAKRKFELRKMKQELKMFSVEVRRVCPVLLRRVAARCALAPLFLRRPLQW
jgi:hypothetical protein